MREIAAKISATKIGALNPNAKAVKCKDVFTGMEIMFDTVKDCQEYFGEKTHRFVTTRVLETTRGLYKNRWAIAYCGNDYKYEQAIHKPGIKLEVTDISSGKTETVASVRMLCREYSISRCNVNKHIHAGEKDFLVDNKYHITILS